MKKASYHFILWVINHFICGTHFFKAKRFLLNRIGIEIGEGSSVVGPIHCGSAINIKVGDNCWLGRNLSFEGNGSVIIGNNIDIAPNCVICTGGHQIGESHRRAGKGEHYTIIIKDGCWLGTNVTIVNNTCINRGTVIAAGAVVICDVEENVVVGGCPAEVKKRLGEDAD